VLPHAGLDSEQERAAEQGFEAATLAEVVAEAGIPMSSVYHYFGSKDGVLLAVMERGARRFFADLPRADRRLGRPREPSLPTSRETPMVLQLENPEGKTGARDVQPDHHHQRCWRPRS
jgi:AcrR family transcriptional regulator